VTVSTSDQNTQYGVLAVASIYRDGVAGKMFLQLCRMAKVVIACRVIPSQKANIVKLVR